MVALDAPTTSTPGDDEVLTTLMQINNPNNVFKEPMPSYRELPPTPTLLSNVKERFLRPCMEEEQEMDEDDIRTRRYWKRWGNRAAKELMKVIDKEKHQRTIKRRELVYSARVREPVYRKDSEDSDTDSDTAISLLTTSSVADAVTFAPIKKLKRRGTRDKENTPKVDWEKFARQRKGLIDRMMRNDRSALGTMVGGGVAGMDVNAREYATDIMSAEERLMLVQCAYRKGLHGTDKSQSTENVVTLWPKRPVTGNRSPAGRVHFQRPPSRSPSTHTPTTRAYPPSRGCTPTPAQVAQRMNSAKRPDSALVHKFPTENDRNGSARDPRSQSIVSKSVPDSVKKYMEGVRGLPDFEGVFSRRVRERIRHTVSALDRIVGDGDDLDVIADIPGERDRYTADDYARVPKYPQRVLIIPQLAKVIQSDIKYRMGRPRCHQIKRHDIRYFDKQNPPIDRSHRNLLIFNWLISISEDKFEITGEPEIVDLEGKLAEYKSVLKHDDVMSRAPTTLSHISGGMSDGASAFTMSNFSDNGHVSADGYDDDDTKTGDDRMSPGISYLSSSRPDTSHT